MWVLPQERERRLTGGHLKEKEVCLLQRQRWHHGMEIFLPSPAVTRPPFVRFGTQRQMPSLGMQTWHQGYILHESHQSKVAATGIDGEHVLVARSGRLSPFPTGTEAEELYQIKSKSWLAGRARGTWYDMTRDRADGCCEVARLAGVQFVYCVLFFFLFFLSSAT